jgi:hypothetical protein
MTEAERITQEMMAAYSTSIRMGLDVSEEAKPIIFDPPRQEQGTINETRRAQALERSMNRRPPRTTAIGASITDDPAIGIRTVVGVGGSTRFYNYGSLNHPYEDRKFPGGFRSAKFQGIGYRLGQQLEAFPKGKTLRSAPLDKARSDLYKRKSAGAITPEYPEEMLYTRTLKNRGGNFQPFLKGKFGKSIPADKVYGAAKGGLQRLAAADPPVVRPGGTYRIPGQVLQGASSVRYVTPRAAVVPGGGARDMALSTLAMPGAQQYIRDNTPQKVARRERLRVQRSQGTDVDNRPSQGADINMTSIRKEQKRATIIRSFDNAFAKARRAGKDEFTWRGKRYNTRLK